MSIYGEGDVRSPHFLSSPMTLIELWRTYPGILAAHDMANLIRSKQLVYDQTSNRYVEPPQKVDSSAVAAPPKGRKAKKGKR